MPQNWIIYTALTIGYIIVLAMYFVRRSKSHENELKNFLDLAKKQLDSHKQQVKEDANQKVTKAIQVVRKVQQAAQLFEDQAQKEYEQIISDAKEEKREIIAQAKSEIEELFKEADRELVEYQLQRQKEIERNLVKLVVAVTEKVVSINLTKKDHEKIIFDSLDDIIKKRAR